MNVTVPVAVPAPGACTVTVAVNVTDCPTLDGFAEEVSCGRGVRLLHFLTKRARGALVVVAIAEILRRDAVRGNGQRGRRQARLARIRSACRSQRRRAIEELHRARGNSRARGDDVHGGGERHRLPELRRVRRRGH